MKVLFLSDANGFERHDPLGILVKFSSSVTKEQMYKLECTQLGATRRGGSAIEICRDLQSQGIAFSTLWEGRRSTFKEQADLTYNLISGNY